MHPTFYIKLSTNVSIMYSSFAKTECDLFTKAS